MSSRSRPTFRARCAPAKRSGSARSGWCSPSCRRPPRRARTTSWRCCAASASAAWRPPRPTARRGARTRRRRARPRRELIGSYLPAELSEEELAGDRRARRARQRRRVGQGHGHGDEAGDGGGRRSRRRQARVGARASGAAGMRTQIELSNEVAAELAGSQDVGAARAGGPSRLQGVPARQPAHLRRGGERDASPASASCASSPT